MFVHVKISTLEVSKIDTEKNSNASMFQWVMNFRNCSSYTQQAHIVHHLYPRGNPKSERPVMRSNRPLQRCTTGPRSVVKSLVTQEQTPITGRRCCHTSSTVYRFGGNERHRQRPGDDGFASHNKPFPLRVQLSRESLGQSRAKQSKRVMKCEGHSAKVPQEIRTVAASKIKLIN